jgi:Golgi apparatus protein 1
MVMSLSFNCIMNARTACGAGKGRMFKCLQENLAQPDFGQACRAQVEERGMRMQEDYRLDYGVAEACEPDVASFCASEKVAS